MASLMCYHHANCTDRPAVATCRSCGKGMCAECSDTFRSRKTGKIMCIECLNKELDEIEDYLIDEQADKEKAFRKIKFRLALGFIASVILVICLMGPEDLFRGDLLSAIVGLIIMSCVFFVFVGFMFLSIPYAFASLRDKGLITGIISFALTLVFSPVIAIVVLVRTLKGRAYVKRMYIRYEEAREANERYFEYARAMSNGNVSEALQKVKAEYESTLAEINSLKEQLALAAETENHERVSELEALLAEQQKIVSDQNSTIKTLESDKGEIQKKLDKAMEWIDETAATIHGNKRAKAA